MVFRVQALNVNGSGPFCPWVSTKSSHKKLDGEQSLSNDLIEIDRIVAFFKPYLN